MPNPVGGQLEQRHHERSEAYNEQWAKTSGCKCDVVLSLLGFYKPFLKNSSHVDHVGLHTRREERPPSDTTQEDVSVVESSCLPGATEAGLHLSFCDV